MCGRCRIYIVGSSIYGCHPFDRKPCPGLFPKCSYYSLPPCGSVVICDQCRGELYSAMAGCLGASRAHFQMETLWARHPNPALCSIRSPPCSGLSLNCEAEPARNSRLDVLYTYTFTSVTITSESNFTLGNVALM